MNFEFKSVDELKEEKGFSSFGKFGVNKANLEKVEFEEGQYGPTLTISFKVEESSYMAFIQPVTKVWKDNIELQPSHPEYQGLVDAENGKIVTYLNQLAEAVISKEAVINFLQTGNFTTIVDYIKGIQKLLTTHPNWNNVDLDVFLQYQYAPTKNNTKTFLEIPKPKNLKNGNLVFVTKHLPGTWNKVVDEKEGLKYTNESGEVHPIKRTAYFMGQPYAKQTETTPVGGVNTSFTPQAMAPTSNTSDSSSTDW